jgi:predicted dehydrogenase
MDKTIIGVAGVGHLGSLHAKILSSMDEAAFAGVFDINAEAAATVAAAYRVRAFKDLDELLSAVRCVVISAPTTAHFAIAERAITRGVHVFIEKPITSTVGEAEKLIRLAKEHRVKIQVGHIERFNPALLALESYMLQPLFIESHRLAQFNPRGTDVAVVLDLMIHDIDIILSLVKSPVESIDANGVAVISDMVDIANARIKFANGCVANVTASRISQKKMRKMRLFQRDAYISIDFSEGVAEVFRLSDGSSVPPSPSAMVLGEIAATGNVVKKIMYEQPEIPNVNALQYELSAFISALRTGSEPVVSGEDGCRALQIAQEIMEKIQHQKLSF